MHHLCSLQDEAVNEGRNDVAEEFSTNQKEFLANFISPWMPKFCTDIRSNSKNGFYIHLADCLDYFLASEMNSTIPYIINKWGKDHAEQAAT